MSVLQPLVNPTSGKRKREDDLRESIDKKKAIKAHYMHKPLRERKRLYCCSCDKMQGITKDDTCISCEHETLLCPICLARRLSDAEMSKHH
jgi:hypothetical protein